MIAEINATRQTSPIDIKKEFFRFFSRLKAQTSKIVLASRAKKRKSDKWIGARYLQEKDAIQSNGQRQNEKRPPSEAVDTIGKEA